MAAYPAIRKGRGFTPEFVNIAGTAGALLAVVAAGAGLSAMLPQTVWFTAASYGAPAAIAFAAYCCVARRLR